MEEILPFAIPILALMIPIIALVLKHQRQMTELIHTRGIQNPQINPNQASEIEQLRSTLVEHSLSQERTIEDLKRRVEQLEQRQTH